MSAKKTEYDLHGRLINCSHRAKMIGQALEALAHSDRADLQKETLYGFGAVAEELAGEIEGIIAAYVAESNARFVEPTAPAGASSH